MTASTKMRFFVGVGFLEIVFLDQTELASVFTASVAVKSALIDNLCSCFEKKVSLLYCLDNLEWFWERTALKSLVWTITFEALSTIWGLGSGK